MDYFLTNSKSSCPCEKFTAFKGWEIASLLLHFLGVFLVGWLVGLFGFF